MLMNTRKIAVFVTAFLLSFSSFLLGSTAAFAQQNILKGSVIDTRGEAVIGAGVVVSGTGNGVVTGVDGTFELPGVAKGETIEISCLGYTGKTIVWNGEVLNVVLEDDTLALDEVVVVGYGTMKKSDLTGSVVKADLSAVKTAPNSNILQALQGGVAGLQIAQTNRAGAEPAIEVRGQTTINGSTDPLIVLDGIIYNGKISDLNPADIVSIDVLKDASSKAVYGAKAANGVLMITTRSGRHEMAPKINYSSNWSYSAPTRNFRPLDREAYVKKARDIDYKNAYTAESGYTQENPSWSITSTGMNDIIYAGVQNGTSYDWWGEGTQTGHLYTNTVSVSGGSQNVSYFLSGSYTDQSGIVKGDDYNRATLRANVDVTLNSWLKLGTNTMLSFNDYSGETPTVAGLARMPSVVGPKDEDGNWIVNPNGSLNVNPFLSYQTDDVEKHNQINTTVYALVSVPWVKGLTYRLNYNYMTNNLSSFNFDRWGAGQTGEAVKRIDNTDYWLLDNIVNYTQTFNRHTINATLVYGANRRTYDMTRATASKFSNFALGYNDLSQGAIQKTESSAWDESNIYQMARLAYNYDGRYFFTATVRRDGFSGFAQDHKFGLFPSAGIGWTVSKEPWMQGASAWLDNLKLRASYGVTGNQTSRYSSLAKIGVTPGYVFGDGATTSSGSTVQTMANSGLKWETTSELNLGADFGFFGGRLSGTVDYYNSNTTDLLWDVAIPTITGFDVVSSNIGKLHNHGVEITLNATPVQTRDFRWNINLNFAANRNRIVSLLGEDKDGDGKEDDLISSGLFIGESLGTIYDYEIDGLWQIEDEQNGTIMKGYHPGEYKIVDQNGDGTITAAEDRKILGHAEPAFTMGIRNSFSYKGFDLSFFINVINGGKDGYMALNPVSIYYDTPGNATNLNWFDCYDYWSPSNPGAKFASNWNTPAVKAQRLESRSFARLQDISLGYSFSPSLLQKAKIDALRLYVSGKNLLTFTSWSGWDPEMGLGISADTYPVMKSVAFGLEITF